MLAGLRAPNYEAPTNGCSASKPPAGVEFVTPSQIPLPSLIPESLRSPADTPEEQDLKLDFPVDSEVPHDLRPESIPPAREDSAPDLESDPNINLDAISVFDDLPEEKKRELVDCACVNTLSQDEELSGFGLALVLRGQAAIMASISDDPTMVVASGTVVCLKTESKVALTLRLVSTVPDTLIASWSPDVIDDALSACPWVMDDLRANAMRLQTIAGALMGPLSESFTNRDKDVLLACFEVKSLEPDEVLLSLDQVIQSLFLVGVGSLEPSTPTKSCGFEVGDAVFPEEALAQQTAPFSVKAGPNGASILHAPSSILQDFPALRKAFLGS